MSEQMSITQKRQLRKQEFKRKFGKYWFIYLALIGTASLSAASGILLPLKPDSGGVIVITWGVVFAAIYYSIGFLTTGEGASYFWFDKITDADPDNNAQKTIAYVSLGVSILTSLITALAAGAFIAYWVGEFDVFAVIPTWAQKWIVWAIPVMWTFHFVMGTVFKSLSEESEYERDAKSIINRAHNDMIRAKEQARANWWVNHAPEIARQMGEAEAQDELDAFNAKIQDRKNRRLSDNNHRDKGKEKDLDFISRQS